MTYDQAITEYVLPALKNTWNEKTCVKVLNALERKKVKTHDTTRYETYGSHNR